MCGGNYEDVKAAQEFKADSNSQTIELDVHLNLLESGGEPEKESPKTSRTPKRRSRGKLSITPKQGSGSSGEAVLEVKAEPSGIFF